MRAKVLLIFVLAVLVFSHSKKGNAQEYYDLHSDNAINRRSEEEEAPTDSTSSGNLTVHTVHYDSLVGNGMSLTSATIPPEYVIMLVSVLTVILVFIVLWLIHFLRERRRASLRNEFMMTSDDAHLSSMALGNDPYKRDNSFESFRVPMPDIFKVNSRQDHSLVSLE